MSLAEQGHAVNRGPRWFCGAKIVIIGKGVMARPAIISLLSELWDFLRIRKKWWLAPIIITLALFGFLIVFTQGSAVAPFVYTLF